MTTGVDISFKQVKVNNKVNGHSNVLGNLSNIQSKKPMNKTLVSFDEDDDEENMNDDNLIELYIYDISGKEIYLDLIKRICNNVSMVIGVFDVCRVDTFKNLQNLLNDLMKQFQITSGNGKNNSINEHSANKTHVIGVILGNKADLSERRCIDEQEAEKFAKRFSNFAYFDCSAKKGFNVEEVFTFLSAKFLEQFYEKSIDF